MPVFICLSLIISILVQSQNPQLNLLTEPFVVYAGTTGAVAAILLLLLKKMPESFCFDLFASCTLLTWFAYWKPDFKDDSPVFFFFPLYFALMTAFVALAFISQRDSIDSASLQQMQRLAQKQRLKPWLVMSAVLVSIVFEEHYLMFPTLMTLLILRFALASCLQPAKLGKK